jgi:hypothetical protein
VHLKGSSSEALINLREEPLHGPMAAAGNTTPSTTQRVNLLVELLVRLAAERWLLKARNLTV